MDSEKIKSTKDLLDIINDEFKRTKYLYRGQHFDKPLLPKFARQAKSQSITNPVNIEERMLDSFKKQSIPHIHDLRPANDWDWLALAQHHGLPTRLLDWSANAFVALWFSIHGRSLQIKSDSILWVLKIEDSDYAPTDRDIDVFSIKRTFIFQPSHLTERIVAQAGWFTVHRYKESKAPYVSLETNKTYKNRLRKYLIPNNFTATILLELKAMGITERSLFPGLESLSKDIERDYFNI